MTNPAGIRAGWITLILGIVLAASGAYLIALLFGYLFGVGGVRRHHVESASYIFTAAALATAFARDERNPREPIGLPRGLTPWLFAGFIAAAALLYASTLSLGLFSDDFGFARNALERRWFPQPELVRPLPIMAWGVLLEATGTPAALHALNIALHGSNAALACLLAVRLGIPLTSAIAAGLLVLVFPSSVEAVAWPAGVHDLLVTTCAIGFLLLAGPPVNARRTIAGIAVLLVGLLSKESALTIPLLALVLWLDPRRPLRTPGWPVLLAGLAVCLVYGVLRVALVPISGSYALEPTRYLVKELLARPVATLTLPWTASVLASWRVLAFAGVAACVAAAGAYAWRTNKSVAPQTIVRCLIAVIVSVGPAYWLLFVTPDLENTRYLYLSTVFWAIAMAGLASTSEGLTRPATAVLFGVLAVAAIGVQMHLTSWKEAARLRERVLASAEHVLKTEPCATVSFSGAPDSVRGAYVFRNGLSPAIALRTGAVPADTRGSCQFQWDGAAFKRADGSSGDVQASFAR